MDDTLDIFQSGIPRSGIKQVSLSEFEMFLGIGELIQEGIFCLISKTSNSSNNMIASLKKLSNDVRSNVT